MFTGVLYQALEASWVPPSVSRSRVPFRVALPLSSMAPGVKPVPRLTGVRAVDPIVYVALDTSLLKKPLCTAIACTVVVLLTVKGDVYSVDELDGVVPFVV